MQVNQQRANSFSRTALRDTTQIRQCRIESVGYVCFFANLVRTPTAYLRVKYRRQICRNTLKVYAFLDLTGNAKFFQPWKI